jgi:glycosyltransferase involved in cell wall biosynthesis
MRIMWNSVAPWVPTGYGTQTAQVCERLVRAGHDVAISANYGWQGQMAAPWIPGVAVYGSDHTGLNKQTLKYHVNHWAAINGWERDTVLVVTLADAHTWLNPKFGGILSNWHDLNQTAWVPVDHETLPPLVEKSLKDYGVTRPIAMSGFGRDRLTEAGFEALYVPHAIDTKTYTPQNRDEGREMLGIPKDRFVVGMVANNAGQTPPRKAFPEVMQAFKRFHADHPDAFLYLHTEMFGFHDGINLLVTAEWFDVPQDAIGAVDQAAYAIGIPDQLMAHVYSAMDVLVNPSYGEGFGVPIIEAQACGTPVIVNDTTAMPELVGAGWVCDGNLAYDATQMAMWRQPDVDSLVACMERAYRFRDDPQIPIDARIKAESYDADVVFEQHWEPVLEKLDGPREVPALVGVNRAARRAAKRKAAA